MSELQRIVVFLAGDRGVRVLEQVLRDGFDVAALAISAQKAPALAATSLASGKTIIDTDDVNNPDTVRRLSDVRSDLFLVAGFGGVFRKTLLEVPKRGVVNLHGGPLPRYRGGSPLNWQIINDGTANRRERR